MENQLILPVGIENFKEIRKDGYYYVDKTALIEQVLEKKKQSDFIYASTSFWKIIEYEYAAVLF